MVLQEGTLGDESRDLSGPLGLASGIFLDRHEGFFLMGALTESLGGRAFLVDRGIDPSLQTH